MKSSYFFYFYLIFNPGLPTFHSNLFFCILRDVIRTAESVLISVLTLFTVLETYTKFRNKIFMKIINFLFFYFDLIFYTRLPTFSSNLFSVSCGMFPSYSWKRINWCPSQYILQVIETYAKFRNKLFMKIINILFPIPY